MSRLQATYHVHIRHPVMIDDYLLLSFADYTGLPEYADSASEELIVKQEHIHFGSNWRLAICGDWYRDPVFFTVCGM